MSDGVLSEQSEQRLEWRTRSLVWLLDHIVGSDEDKCQFLDMFHEALHTAQREGTEDAVFIVDRCAGAARGETKRALDIVAGSLRELMRRNDAGTRRIPAATPDPHPETRT